MTGDTSRGRLLPVLRRLATVLFVVAIVVGVAVALRDADWAAVRAMAQPSDLALLGAALLVNSVGLVLGMLSWRSLLAGLGSRLGVWTAARIFFVGMITKFVPGRFWALIANIRMGRTAGVTPARMATGYVLNIAVMSLTGLTVGLVAAPSVLGGQAGWLVLAALPVLAATVRPELANRLAAALARLLRRPTLLLLVLQQFVHLFPIQALVVWSIRYFQVERGFDDNQIYVLSGSLVVVGIGGFLVAGWLGDRLFQRIARGRLLLGTAGVGLAAVTMTGAFLTPTDDTVWFMALWALASFCYGFSNPTVTPSVQDVTEPEVRSTAHALMSFAEQGGSALAPLVVGLLAEKVGLGTGLTAVVATGFCLSAFLLMTASLLIPYDIRRVRARPVPSASGEEPALAAGR